MSRPSNMKHAFSSVPQAKIPRSAFNRSHSYKTTFDENQLVPFFVDEALPGDTFNLKANCFCRMATPIRPLMDNLYLDTFFFAVPYRLVWDNWQKFNGEQKNPGDSTDYLIPQVVAPEGGFDEGTLADYMGLPTKVGGISVSALFGRAYYTIYNEWFRDENLLISVDVSSGDGPDNIDLFNHAPMLRCKRHDYFTSCLPWPQKGPGVELSLAGEIPVYGDGKTLGLWQGSTVGKYYGLTTGESLDYSLLLDTSAYGTPAGSSEGGAAPTSYKSLGVTPRAEYSGLVASLDDATAVTINSLRQAFQLQALYERDARGGTRYTEIIRAHFGVISPDARLQRSEYLGGASYPINVNPVVQQSGSTEVSPQGNLSAFVVGSNRSGFIKSFTEHTIIIGLVNVRADLTYQQGIDRMWSRRSRFDFYWPALAHLGEQAVLNKEIYAQGTEADDEVFGYQERWAEMRYCQSRVTGKFRSNATGTLDSWHLSQDFASLPTLSSDFIVENVPVDRVVAVPSEPHFLLDVWFNYKTVRPMPVYSVPGLVSHF